MAKKVHPQAKVTPLKREPFADYYQNEKNRNRHCHPYYIRATVDASPNAQKYDGPDYNCVDEDLPVKDRVTQDHRVRICQCAIVSYGLSYVLVEESVSVKEGVLTLR
jgi:hypothetical protein